MGDDEKIANFVGGKLERQNMKALIHTLGCKLNFAESAAIAAELEARGIAVAEKGEVPDVVLMNSCSVTAEADKKSRQTVRALHRRYPEAAIFVTGCYAQLRSEEALALDGVVAVMGNDRKDKIADQILAHCRGDIMPAGCGIERTDNVRGFLPTQPCVGQGERTRWFLKVQDGCDYWCSYCTIPIARGQSRSPRVADVVDEARRASEQGAREIVITGVNIGDFGKGGNERFFDLCRALDKIEEIERYRISSIEPNLLTDEMIDWLARESRAFMPHFHIPLQSGSDAVLRNMGRHYDTQLFADKISKIRAQMPDAFIGVDLIVGFRGETLDLYEESREFVRSLDISRLHVFPYSERADTRALKITPVVDVHERSRRAAEMIALSEDKLREFSRRFVGSTRKVLFEVNGTGFTDNYLRVNVKGNSPASNAILPVRLDSLDEEKLIFNGTL